MKSIISRGTLRIALYGVVMIIGSHLTRYHDWREIVGLVLLVPSAILVGWFGRAERARKERERVKEATTSLEGGVRNG